MADLSFLAETDTVVKIDRAFEAANKPRAHLGLSAAGDHCARKIWYMHHGHVGEQPFGRVLRLFSLGNAIEDEIISGLRLAGCTVTDQQREVRFTQEGVELLGHIDGIVSGLEESSQPHLFEAKSASSKRFKELQEHGDYRQFSEAYFWQVNFYMLGLGLKRAAVFVYNKDNSELMMVRVRLDREATIEKLQQIFETITGELPDRSCPREDFYKAKLCSYRALCFGCAPVADAWGW